LHFTENLGALFDVPRSAIVILVLAINKLIIRRLAPEVAYQIA
jgi:hypothetical protein